MECGDDYLAEATTDGRMPLNDSLNFSPEKYGSTTNYQYSHHRGDFKYFEYGVERPDLGGVILPYGLIYENIGSAFLDGFINYYRPIRAYLLNAYHDWNLEVLGDSNEVCPVDINVKSSINPSEINAILINRNNEYWPT